MNENKKILMICYYYPPLRDVGCKRSYFFSKYLKKHDWNPYVLSVKNPDKQLCYLGNDNPPENVKVKYSYSIINPSFILGKINGLFSKICNFFGKDLSWDFMNQFCIPDIFCGWIPHTLFMGYKTIRTNNINFIYASVSPFSGAIIGLILKKLTNKQLIIDYRDPFALKITPLFNTNPLIMQKIKLSLEKLVLRNCDLFIVNTKETQKAYIKQYPWIKHKIHSIYNGFDIQDLSKNKKSKFKKFTIIYTGNFYTFSKENNEYANAFFQALKSLQEKGTISSQNFQFLFYGSNSHFIYEYAKKHKITNLVFIRKPQQYKTIIKLILKSHVMLLRIVKLMISTKLYEGLALNIPFIATIPDGEAKEIITNFSQSSKVITTPTAKDIQEAIINLKQQYDQNNIYNNNVRDFLKEFSRESLTLKLIKLLNNEEVIKSV